MKKLRKSTSDRLLFGVCGGIGEYLNIDSNIIRLVWILFAFTGAGVIAYFIATFLLPTD